MTKINLRALIDALGGAEAIPRGQVSVSYRDSDGPAQRGAGATVIFPSAITVAIENGEPVKDLIVDATGPSHFARIKLEGAGFDPITRNVAIPDVPEVDFYDLVDVDPATFEPLPAAPPSAQELIARAETAISTAEESLAESAASAGAASDSAASAADSAGSALVSKESAAESAGQASSDAAMAESARSEAIEARDSAVQAGASATTAAASAQEDAQIAMSSREAAQSSASAAAASASDALEAAGDAHASSEVATAQAAAAGQSAFSASAFASAADGSRISAADAAATSVQLKLDTEQYKIQAEAAAALALSGQFAGSRIPSGVHLDTVTAQGVYFQNQTSDITTENGYPVAGNPGRGTMLVFRWAAAVGNYFQVYFTIGDNSDRAVMYVRRGGTSSGVITWGAWRVTPTLSYGSLGEMLFYDGSANRQLKPIGGAFSSGNLDNLTAAGSYYNTTTTTATIGNNWPIAGVIGEVDVIPVSPGGNLIQVITPMGGTMLLRGQYRRSKASGTFGPWRFTPTSYVDQTAGRTLSLWDDVNNRTQMVYGDTGWRDISSLLENNWGGKVQVLRTGSSVEVRARTLVAGTAVTVFTLPTGFRPGGGSSTLSFPIMARPASNSATPIYGTVDAFGAVALRTDAGAFNDASLQFTFTTRDTWPTSLPGIAVGSIPT